jgi:hypothetical protein
MLDKSKLEDHIQLRMQSLREEKSCARHAGDSKLRDELSAEHGAYRDMQMRLIRGDFNIKEDTHDPT